MKYVIKGGIDLKIGDNILLPCACNLHIDGILTDETSAYLCGQCSAPNCLEPHQSLQTALSEILRPNWLKNP